MSKRFCKKKKNLTFFKSFLFVIQSSRHHYTVDCGKANKGLFAGILVLVITIISLVLFFALINHPKFKVLAITEVSVARFTLIITSFIAVSIGIFQVLCWAV